MGEGELELSSVEGTSGGEHTPIYTMYSFLHLQIVDISSCQCHLPDHQWL